MSINKKELIKRVTQRVAHNSQDVEEVINATLDEIWGFPRKSVPNYGGQEILWQRSSGDRFWLKSMPTAPKWPQNLPLADYGKDFQQQVSRKVEAFERFVNLNAIALGLLQVLALEMPQQVWALFPLWFRTLPKHGFPSEQIVRLSLQHQLHLNLARSRPGLLLAKLLTAKMGTTAHPDVPPLVA